MLMHPLSCVLIAGAACSASLCAPSAPAGADPIAQQITALQHQAAQLSSEMLLEQLQIGGYEQQYNAAIVRVQHDQQLTAQIQLAITRNQQRVGHDTTVLQQATVTAYVDGGTTANVTPLFSDQRADGDRGEYQTVLASTVTDAVDQLRSDRQTLRAKEATLENVEAEDESTQAESQQLLEQAQNTEGELEQQSTQIQGALAVAVAQQQAEEAAAAAAAVAAAQAKAEAQAEAAAAQAEAVAATTPAAVGPQSTSTVGPALNSFLQCVVQAESGGDYQAVSPTGTYMGAFQFSQSTWNDAAMLAGLPTLVGVPPDEASPAEQDELAVALYAADGSAPWYDPCTGR